MGAIRRVDLLIFVYRLIHYKQMDLYVISEDLGACVLCHFI